MPPLPSGAETRRPRAEWGSGAVRRMPLEVRNRAPDGGRRARPETVSEPRTAGDPQTSHPGAGHPTDADVLGIPPDAVRQALLPPEDQDPDAFMPTAGMVQAKSLFWSIVAHDPSLLPDRMTREQVLLILGDPRLKNWYKRSGAAFHAWLLNKHEHETLAVAAYDRWIRMVPDRMRDMQDKDFIQLGKLLAEVARRMPERWMKEKLVDGDVAKMDDNRLMDLLLTTAKNLGWKVDIPADSPGASLLNAPGGAARPTKGT